VEEGNAAYLEEDSKLFLFLNEFVQPPVRFIVMIDVLSVNLQKRDESLQHGNEGS